MNINLLFATGTIIDLAMAAILLIVAIVGLCTGFMKNGLNNLCFLAEIIIGVLLVPVCKSIALIADLQNALASALGFLSPNLQASVAGAVVSVVLFLILYILLSIVFALLKKLLRALIKPQRGVLKALDRIFGALFGMAFYLTVLFTLTGVIATLPTESIRNAFAESKLYQINYMREFCDENLNLGEWLASLETAIPDGTEPQPEVTDGDTTDGGETVTEEDSSLLPTDLKA